MTLEDEIITIDYMIRNKPDSTIADYAVERKQMLKDEEWHRKDELRRQRHLEWLAKIKNQPLL